MIDFHTHIFPEKLLKRPFPFWSGNVGSGRTCQEHMNLFLSSMEEAKIEQSIVLPVVTRPSQFDSINRFAAR